MEPRTEVAGQPKDSAEAGTKSARILLVEDNIINQTVARKLLKKNGYATDVAANGQLALEALSTASYDLVLMDCQMPVMDGYEATRRIRAEDPAVFDPSIPIIAMTANALPGDREKCLDAGMDDYIAKPIRVSTLTEVLRKYLQESAT